MPALNGVKERKAISGGKNAQLVRQLMFVKATTMEMVIIL